MTKQGVELETQRILKETQSSQIRMKDTLLHLPYQECQTSSTKTNCSHLSQTSSRKNHQASTQNSRSLIFLRANKFNRIILSSVLYMANMALQGSKGRMIMEQCLTIWEIQRATWVVIREERCTKVRINILTSRCLATLASNRTTRRWAWSTSYRR